MDESAMPLNQHLQTLQHESQLPADLGALLLRISAAACILSREIERAALTGNLGITGEENATGDSQKKLDVFSSSTLVDALNDTNLVSAVVSEELTELQALTRKPDAPFVVCLDPLDGSSNIDVNGSVGTIFGIYRRTTQKGPVAQQDVLRKGSELVAAGYILYSASTLFVYSCGRDVQGFTLAAADGQFLQSHENITCPRRGDYYSANLGNSPEWEPGIQAFARHAAENTAASGKSFSLRYTGALVADFHRTLLEGGLYFYPSDAKYPKGKLRLLYECAPLAYLAEDAGARASTGRRRILDIQPVSIHQQEPLVIGSAEDVELFEQFVRGANCAEGTAVHREGRNANPQPTRS